MEMVRKTHWFSDQTFIITGGSSGIGLEISKLLLQGNAKIIAISNDPTEFQNAQKSLGENIDRIEFIECDITKESDRMKIGNNLNSRSMAGLINCAGILTYGKFFETPKAELARVLEVNYVGTILLIREIFPLVLSQAVEDARLAYLVFISSLSPFLDLPYFGVYPSSKAGVDAFFRGLSHEMPQNIKVLLIRPSSVRTDLYTKAGIATGASREILLKNTRMMDIKPEQVAKTVVKAIEKKKTGIIYPTYLTKVQMRILNFPVIGSRLRKIAIHSLERGT